MLQPERRRHVADHRLALIGRLADDGAQRRQGVALRHRPGDRREPLARAAQRQVVADDPEEEVVAEDVRPGQQDQEDRTDPAEQIDDQPEAVPLPVALQRVAEQLLRLGRREVVGMDEGRRGAATLPELFRFPSAN